MILWRVVAWILVIFGLFFYCYNLVADDDGLEKEKRARVQTLYDYGLKYYHEKGSKYQGCYLLRQAVKEARYLKDDKETLNKIYPVYESTCKSTAND